jgi:hypothetical protein
MGARFAAVGRLSRPPKVKFGAQARAKMARPKAPRTEEERARHREYMRAYMRESRARQKVDASTNLQGAPPVILRGDLAGPSGENREV